MIGSTTFMTSRLAYDAAGGLTEAPQYRKIESSLLVEYGLSPNVTLIFNPVVRDVLYEGAQTTFAGHGLSSLEAGARWRLFDYDGQAVSFQATTRVPARSNPLFDFENRSRTELRFGYGMPLIINGKQGFGDSSVSWVKRHEARADEVKFELTYGWWQRSNRMVLVQYFTTIYPGSGLNRDPRQHKVQTSTVYKLDNMWSVQLGSFVTRGGRLTRREAGTVMAVWRSF